MHHIWESLTFPSLFTGVYVGSHIWVFPKNSEFSLQIIHFHRVFHYFHHPFWGVSLFLETPPICRTLKPFIIFPWGCLLGSKGRPRLLRSIHFAHPKIHLKADGGWDGWHDGKVGWCPIYRVTHATGLFFTCTPWKTNMEPENHSCEKEKHLPNLHFWVPCQISGV